MSQIFTLNANAPLPPLQHTDVAIQWGLLEFSEHFFTLRHFLDCPTVKYSQIKNKTQKIHVPILLNGNKNTVKFIFEYVFYTTKYNSAKTKCKVPPTIAPFSSGEYLYCTVWPISKFAPTSLKLLRTFCFQNQLEKDTSLRTS